MRRGQSGINCLLAVDKPLGMTSHDVVNHVRRALGERRVGHAGTLDPAASGVLVVGVGQGTRLMGLLSADTKSYLARIRFGTETTTDDAEGEVTVERPVPDRLSDEAFAREAVDALVGEHDQVPPSFSAISVNGVRAYDRARRGEDVKLKSRHVTISVAMLVGVCRDDGGIAWDCAFTVSKGTYVRSIARDLGRELGCAAHLEGLRRTASGLVGLGDCVALDRLESEGPAALAKVALDPTRYLGLPVRRLSVAEFADAMCGKALSLAGPALAEGGRVSLVHDDRLVGVWSRQGSRLRCELNFPQGISGVRA